MIQPFPSILPWPEKFSRESLPTKIGGLRPCTQTWDEFSSESRASAILLLFIRPEPGQTDARILLIRRSAQLRSHRGQIGLPGGRREVGDITPIDTALRETKEELGISQDKICVLGLLPKAIALDGTPVIPVIGICAADLDELQLASSEVEQAFAFPWKLFTFEKYHPFSMNIFGIRRKSGVFTVQDRRIWGLTAHVLCTAEIG